MGVSTFPDFADSEDSLLRSVDAALYEAKGKGKNRVEIAGS
jgi:PleD family two-component response regulator